MGGSQINAQGATFRTQDAPANSERIANLDKPFERKFSRHLNRDATWPVTELRAEESETGSTGKLDQTGARTHSLDNTNKVAGGYTSSDCARSKPHDIMLGKIGANATMSYRRSVPPATSNCAGALVQRS
jgi:hypothetical protein